MDFENFGHDLTSSGMGKNWLNFGIVRKKFGFHMFLIFLSLAELRLLKMMEQSFCTVELCQKMKNMVTFK